MTEKKTLTFEEAYSKLEECSRNASREGLTLNETIDAYEEGVKYYAVCKELLEDANRRIAKIDKTTGEAQDV